MDQAECIVLIPNWPAQPYYSKVMEMLVSLPLVLPSLQGVNISGHCADIILASWRSGTQRQYETYINKWLNYCCERELDSLQPSLASVIQFLAALFEKNLSYNSLNTARSALSTNITVHWQPPS